MKRAAILFFGLLVETALSAPVLMAPTNAVHFETFGALPTLGTGITYSWVNDNAVNRTFP